MQSHPKSAKSCTLNERQIKHLRAVRDRKIPTGCCLGNGLNLKTMNALVRRSYLYKSLDHYYILAEKGRMALMEDENKPTHVATCPVCAGPVWTKIKSIDEWKEQCPNCESPILINKAELLDDEEPVKEVK